MVVFSVASVFFIPSVASDASVMEGIATEQKATAPTNLPGIPATEVQEAPAADAPVEAPAQ